MPQFNFKDYVFNHLFNYKFHSEDTYKDSEGRGILERFISICSEYFDENIIPDIKGLPDIIDIETTPENLLPYLWEYLGKIPFAFSTLHQLDLTQTQIENAVLRYPHADTRRLLKYAISLYKIRCTPAFYNILGSYYGVDITVTNEQALTVTELASYDEQSTTYDEISDYDQEDDCLQCVKVEFTVNIPPELMTEIKLAGQVNTIQKSFIELINRYLPIHVLDLDETTLIIKSE